MKAKYVGPSIAALLLCGAACQGHVDGVDTDGATSSEEAEVEVLGNGKADGIVFTRTLTPIETTLTTSTLEGQFEAGRYVAYSFETSVPIRLFAHLQFVDGWRDFWTALNLPETYEALGHDYRSTLALFRLDESALAADSTDPEELWDLEATGLDNGILDHAITSGLYLLVALATPDAYENQTKYLLDIRSQDSLLSDVPGNMTVSVVTYEAMSPIPAAGIRVALSNVAAITDENGEAVLQGVPAGEHVLKLGPDGTGRAVYSELVRVFGDNIDQKTTALIEPSDYTEWRSE